MRQNNPEVNYPPLGSPGGGGVFLEEAPRSRQRKRDIVLGTWNVRSLYIILRWIFRKWEGVVRTGWSWLRIGTGGGHL